jgi:hypothetical protein
MYSPIGAGPSLPFFWQEAPGSGTMGFTHRPKEGTMRSARWSFTCTLIAWAALGPLAAFAKPPATAWQAALDMLPQEISTVVAVDLATLRKLPAFDTLLTTLLAKNPEIGTTLDSIKSKCGIEATRTLTTLVIGMTDQEKGAVVATVTGVNDEKVTACIIALANDKNLKVTAKRTGAIVEYGVAGEHEKTYLAWPAEGLVVMASDAKDLALLKSMLEGKDKLGKRPGLEAKLKTLNNGAAIWFFTDLAQDLSPGKKMLGAAGTAEVASTTLSISLTFSMETAQTATTFAQETNEQLRRMANQLPPQMAKLITTTKIVSAGKDVTLKGAFADKDLADLMTAILAGGVSGGGNADAK